MAYCIISYRIFEEDKEEEGDLDVSFCRTITLASSENNLGKG